MAATGVRGSLVALVYLLAMTGLVVARTKGHVFSGTYRLLWHTSVALASVLLAIALLSGPVGRSPWPAILLASLIAVHATSVELVWRQAQADP